MREQLMLAAAASGICLHCERRPTSCEARRLALRLCDVCAAVRNLRRIYRRRRRWTRERERRIQTFVERARAGLPLFEK